MWKLARHCIRPCFSRASKDVTRCLVIHPVAYPNKGPVVEQYLAQQAIGLVKSLSWMVVEGPLWNAEAMNGAKPRLPQSEDRKGRPYREGEYIYEQGIRGRQRGGIILDLDTSSSEGDLYDQWKNKLKRESLANKCLIRTRYITSKLFFTRGKAEMIANFVRQNNIDCVFINTDLSPVQIKNLKKLFESRVNNIVSPKSVINENLQTQTEFESEPQTKESRQSKEHMLNVKIFDRFSIILQIFARRAKTNIAKLQIQLNYLNYLKTKLMRTEGSTYSSSYNIFYGDLMKAEQVNLEIVSARQRRAHAAMSGAGESQLEIQRRQVRDKETKIKRQLDQQKRVRLLEKQKRKIRKEFIGQIGLIGYTNAGKSALMNKILKRREVSSADMLFQTLSTTTREFPLPSGSKAILLDTIGFISNLPHQLIDSFKVTLEEVEDCTVVLHIRDMSNPNHQHQKEIVLRVLRQLGFPEDFYTQRMIEVWNKIDLFPESIDSPPGVFQISALKGQGIPELLEQIQKKTTRLLNLGTYKLKYGVDKHFKRLNWLKENTNAPRITDEVYDYTPSPQFPHGTVSYTVILDPASYGKYMKFINEPIVVQKQQKGMPPPNWNK